MEVLEAKYFHFQVQVLEAKPFIAGFSVNLSSTSEGSVLRAFRDDHCVLNVSEPQ